MNLGDWASVAATAEAIFVILSVLFIWYELRQNRKLTRVANVQTLVELSSPLHMQLIQDRGMVEL